ncbi:hypothetical protein SCLCIDRAFT_766680 [Scleroderma citrinum Foug A]|uniref:Uncharacterized protein n=1 Tax=Scleroderma citrinum Foug A TaxID=1036808 RepID=A0A0C3D3Q1_9AGAM|nr:hypothetical protein SCLCIDRAFT_766680 [Scleroderma citrinum Foug A]
MYLGLLPGSFPAGFLHFPRTCSKEALTQESLRKTMLQRCEGRIQCHRALIGGKSSVTVGCVEDRDLDLTHRIILIIRCGRGLPVVLLSKPRPQSA